MVARGGIGDDAIHLGARDGDIQQAPLLLDLIERASTHGAGEQVLFHAHDDDVLELKALGGMHRHQGDFLAVGVVHVLVGEQRGLGQEVTDLVMLVTALLLDLLEVVDGVDQLVQVLDAADVLGRVVAHEHALDARALHHLLGHVKGVVAVAVELDEAFHECGETLQLGHGAAVHVEAVLFRIVDDLPQADPILGGGRVILDHSGIADAACRIVDDAPQGLVIVGVDDEPQVADGIFHLLALIERQTAIDAVGDSAAHVAVLVAAAAVAQGFLQYTRLGVGAVEYGVVLVAVALTGFKRCNLVGDDIGLLVVAIALDDRNALAHGVLAEQVLGDLAAVFLDEAVGGIGDCLGRAVVAFQLECFYLGVEPLQAQDVVNVGSAKAVDALGIVAHDAQAVILFAQLVNNQVLREIGVLILIHEDIAEELLILLQHVGIIAQQDIGVEQQVVEVHRSGDAATAPVLLVDGCSLGTLGVAVGINQVLVAGIVLGGDQRVLGIADLRLDGGGLIDLVVEAHILDDELDEGARVTLVVDGEITPEADAVGIAAQQAGENGVERAHPQLGGDIGARKRFDALAHLAGSLVGEGERHDAPRFVAQPEQMHDFVGQHARLARAGPRNHQLRPVAILDGRTLLLIQFLQIIFIHGCKYTTFSVCL